jgi:CubicO group peptidase (beta-lactamase class C family)
METDALNHVLQPYVDSGTLAGAVTLVADANEVLSLGTIGFSDIAAKKPMRTDTLFWIASQTKPITGTALMMLVDEGKVVDDPVEKYLPEFKGQWLAVEQDEEHVLLRKPKRPITVADVLRHTSGMPFRSAMEEPTLDGLPLEVAVRSYAMTPLQFEPGSQYQYANTGTNTAGRILEVVSGMPYEEFLDTRLLGPLGMKDTTFWPSAEQLTRLATAYKPNADNTGLEETRIAQLHYPLDDRKRRYPMPAGGLFSTARDVCRFCQMILKGGIHDGKRYLSEAAFRQMTHKQTGDTIETGYGFGWATDGNTFGHSGAMETNMTIDAKQGLITVFLIQHAYFPEDGGEKIRTAFREAATERFGKKEHE